MVDPIRIPIGVDLSDSLESVQAYSRMVKDAFENTTSTAVEKALKKVDDFNRKLAETNAIIDANKKKITDLAAQKEKASADERKRIEQEIDGLKKITQARELELVSIEQKRTKATEVYALMTSKSKAEVDAVKQTTQARNVELGVMKDQIRAQGQVTEEVTKGTNAVQNYVSGFFGLQAVGGILTSIQSALERQRKEIQQTTEAAGKLRDLAEGENEDRNQQFFNEFGLNTKDERTFGAESVNSIARRFNLQPGTVSKAAGNVGASLRSIGVSDFTSDRFKSLVGTAGLAEFRGINTGLLTDVFQQNPNITGDQLNKQVQNILAVTGGSATRANLFLESYRENRLKLGAAGVGSLDDALKIWQNASKQVSPEAVPSVFQALGRAVDKFGFGDNVEEKADLAMKLGMAGAGSTIPILMRPGAVNVPEMLGAIGNLPGGAREEAAKALAGARGGVALSAIANFRNEKLPTGGGQLLGSQTAEELTAAQRAIARATTAEENRPNPFAERFRQEVDLQKTRLLAHPEELSPLANQFSSLRTQFPNITELTSGTTEDALFKQSSQVQLSQRITALQNLKAQRPELGSQIDALIGQYQGLLSNPDAYTNPQKVGPVIQQQEQMMQGVRSSPARPTTRPTTLDYSIGTPGGSRSIPTPPPTGPSSINYHIRQVNYGVGYDSIGAPASLDTRYS